MPQVIARLARHPHVVGILQIGSATTGAFSVASDYDLVIVLAEGRDPWYVGVTTIDGRFTDLLFVADAALTRILSLAPPLAADDPLTPIVRWVRQGQIHFDRHGRLALAQAHVGNDEWVAPAPDDAVYGAWFAVNYNLAQTRRMRQSPDPLYQQAVDLRLALYGYTDVWWSYFSIRRLNYTGEKAALRYLHTNDPTFLAIYQQFVAVADRDRKFQLYEQAVAQVVAPLDGLWPATVTAMNAPGTLAVWQALLATH